MQTATLDVATVTGRAISLEGVAHSFGPKRVLDSIDLEVPLHGRLGIVGRSGSGKSTLLTFIAGLADPDAGTIEVGGATAGAERLAQCALMPQRDGLLPWRSALDNACLALENRGLSRADARRRAAPFFERLGLGGSERQRPSRLSGGMRQRVAFLRTLLADKEVLLLDEPFGALDAITRAELQDWLAGVLDSEPRTMLLVTHDVEEALLLSDRVAVLADGRIATVLDVDVPRLRTDPAFVELREQALEALT